MQVNLPFPDGSAQKRPRPGTATLTKTALPAITGLPEAHVKLVLRRGRHLILPALGLVACAVILMLLRHLLLGVDYHGTVRALRHLPSAAIGWSVLATAVSYAALVGRDATLLSVAGVHVSRMAVVLGAVCGSALGNAVGTGALTGGAVRYRVYGSAGVRPEQVAQLMLLITISFAGGLIVLAAASGAITAPAIAALLKLPVAAVRLPSLAVILVCVILLLTGRMTRSGRTALSIGRWQVPRLPAGVAMGQLGLVAADLLGAGVALWVLLPSGHAGFTEFMAVFAVATACGVISHVPGGLGVFEAVVLFGMRGKAPTDLVAAGLLAYRAIYFLLPLLLSGSLLSAFELRAASARIMPQYADRAKRTADQLAPALLGVVTFAIGGMLVLSGAMPAFGHRPGLLRLAAPLWFVEASHFLGSLAGMLLLFVARGLFHRLDGAWWFAFVLAWTSLLLSLGKGLAFGEAAVLLCLIVMLWSMRARFDRPASVLRQRFTLGWFAGVSVVAAVAISVLWFAFSDLAYNNDLWWQFEFDAKAPRALRATLGAGLLAGAIALWQLLRVAPGEPNPPSKGDLADVARIVAGQERSSALLALLGDKSFLFSPSRTAFLMYARRGRTWVALYDPVGPRAEWTDLIWRFVELVDSRGGRVAFYQVRPDSLPLYLDAGLKLIKLGEEAVIDLEDFELKGAARSHLRYALKRGERDGLTYELVPQNATAAMLPDLKPISDAWLHAHQAAEKSFSVAAFQPDFVAAQAVAVVRHHDTPIAFATVMATSVGREATIGIMRNLPAASPYAMEFLFTNLALELKQAGCQRLSLGMVPLAGLETSPLASLWHHIGSLLRQHGGWFYKFQGLRTFKSKFGPKWEPRYLAASGSVAPFVALADCAVLMGMSKT
jgi:phosphatidylglycerol lysyltransferase